MSEESPIPHGMGGLKSHYISQEEMTDLSHPTRDGWIEITGTDAYQGSDMSHPTRDGWIEIPEST